MSINQFKALIWVASLGVAGFLGYYAYDFFSQRDELMLPVASQETMQDILGSIEEPEPPKEDVVDYGIVLKTWHNMAWIPQEPTKVDPAAASEEVETKLPYKPVAELLEVTMLYVDGGDPAGSMAQVNFLDASLSRAATSEDQRILREETKLSAPYEHIVVAAINREGVWFRFEGKEGEEERAVELVEPSRMDTGPRIVAANGAEVVRPTRPEIPQATSRPKVLPKETTLVGPNKYWVGTDDRTRMATDYTGILAELRFAKHRDPKTGRPDGIEIKDVPEGSFASKYGVKSGQVVKSVNGKPVNSVNEGISYAKQNQDKYDIWTIVYEEQGKEKTMVIDTSDD